MMSRVCAVDHLYIALESVHPFIQRHNKAINKVKYYHSTTIDYLQHHVGGSRLGNGNTSSPRQQRLVRLESQLHSAYYQTRTVTI